MKQFATACLIVLALAGCGATPKQLKEAASDCRERNPDAAEAIAACSELLEHDGTPEQRAGYLAARGTAYARSDQNAEAMNDLTAALALVPGLTNARLERAKIEEKQGDTAAARADLDQVLTEGPWIVEALVRRARLEMAAGENQAAINDLTEALKLRPERSDTWSSRAAAHRSAGNPRAAAEDYGEAIRLRPGPGLHLPGPGRSLASGRRQCGRSGRCGCRHLAGPEIRRCVQSAR